MKKEFFTPLHVTLNFAALIVAIYAALHWGAFMAIRKAGTEMAPALQSACQALKGCQRIEAGYRWSGSDNEFVSEAVVVQNKMSAMDKSSIEANIRQAFELQGNQTLVFGSLIKKVHVRYEHEK